MGRDPPRPGAHPQPSLEQGHSRRALPPRRRRRRRLTERRRGVADAGGGGRAAGRLLDASSGRRSGGVAAALATGRGRGRVGGPDRQPGASERGGRSLPVSQPRPQGRPDPVRRIGPARGRRTRGRGAQREPSGQRRAIHLERSRRAATLRQHGGARHRPGEPAPARPNPNPRGRGAPGGRRRVRDRRRAGGGSSRRDAASRDRLSPHAGPGVPGSRAARRPSPPSRAGTPAPSIRAPSTELRWRSATSWPGWSSAVSPAGSPGSRWRAHRHGSGPAPPHG